LRQGCQKDNTRGLMSDGGQFEEHQKHLRLKDFASPAEEVSSVGLGDRRSEPLGSAGLPG
jgi:hypothetical protein